MAVSPIEPIGRNLIQSSAMAIILPAQAFQLAGQNGPPPPCAVLGFPQSCQPILGGTGGNPVVLASPSETSSLE